MKYSLLIMNQKEISYFEKEKNLKNHIFFQRFSNLDYKNLTILDLGCGHGAISIDLVLRGASEVIGIDLENDLFEFANKNLTKNYFKLKNKNII